LTGTDLLCPDFPRECFVEKVPEHGYMEGQNIAIGNRFVDGDRDRLEYLDFASQTP
jgi:hypothetical protein